MPCSVSPRSEKGTWKQKRLILSRPKTNSIAGTTVTDKEGGAQILSFREGRRGKWGNASDPAPGMSLLLPFPCPHCWGHRWALLPVALTESWSCSPQPGVSAPPWNALGFFSITEPRPGGTVDSWVTGLSIHSACPKSSPSIQLPSSDCLSLFSLVPLAEERALDFLS